MIHFSIFRDEDLSTCYASAAVQLLYSCPTFISDVLELADEMDRQTSQGKGAKLQNVSETWV